MAMTEERKEYLYQYQKEKLKRVPLDLKKSDYEKVASAANEKGVEPDQWDLDMMAQAQNDNDGTTLTLDEMLKKEGLTYADLQD